MSELIFELNIKNRDFLPVYHAHNLSTNKFCYSKKSKKNQFLNRLMKLYKQKSKLTFELTFDTIV